MDSVQWLRDWAGVDLPARAPVSRPFRRTPPDSSLDKESFSLLVVLLLERLAASHPCPRTRGQAAGWAFLARSALRGEQSKSCFINAIFPHTYRERTFTIVSGAVRRDKHPDPSKRRPRPFWAVVDSILHGDAVRRALVDSLAGAEAVGCILRDTDSPNGDPTRSTVWLSAPLSSPARMDASLHAVLRAAGVPPDVAARIHSHGCKRFTQNVCESDPSLGTQDAAEVGRFSGSTAQFPDLEPTAAMLRQHELRSAVLPGIYAGKSCVLKVFDRLAAAHLAMERVALQSIQDPSFPPLPFLDGWELFWR